MQQDKHYVSIPIDISDYQKTPGPAKDLPIISVDTILNVQDIFHIDLSNSHMVILSDATMAMLESIVSALDGNFVSPPITPVASSESLSYPTTTPSFNNSLSKARDRTITTLSEQLAQITTQTGHTIDTCKDMHATWTHIEWDSLMHTFDALDTLLRCRGSEKNTLEEDPLSQGYFYMGLSSAYNFPANFQSFPLWLEVSITYTKLCQLIHEKLTTLTEYYAIMGNCVARIIDTITTVREVYNHSSPSQKKQYLQETRFLKEHTQQGDMMELLMAHANAPLSKKAFDLFTNKCSLARIQKKSISLYTDIVSQFSSKEWRSRWEGGSVLCTSLPVSHPIFDKASQALNTINSHTQLLEAGLANMDVLNHGFDTIQTNLDLLDTPLLADTKF